MGALGSQLGQTRPLCFQLFHRLAGQQARQASNSLFGAGFSLLQQAQEQCQTGDLAQRRQLIEGHAPIGIQHPGAAQQIGQHGLNPRQLQDFCRAERLEQILQASRIVLRQRTPIGHRLTPLRLQLPEGLLESVLEVVIQRSLENGQSDFCGLGRTVEARSPNGLQANARALVVGQLGEERQSIGNAVTPVAKDAAGSSAGVGLG